MRHQKVNEKDSLACYYGNDHAVGIFLTVWKIDTRFPVNSLENICDSSNVIYEEDETFHKLTESALLAKAKEYGFEIDPNELIFL